MGIEKLTVHPAIKFISDYRYRLVAVVGVSAIIYFDLSAPQYGRAEYVRTYRQALLDYADTNHDRFVTSAEKEKFDRILFEGRRINLIPGDSPHYGDGTAVPPATLTEWIKDYRSK